MDVLKTRSFRPLLFPHEQEVATVMAGLADVGVLRRLLGDYHHVLGAQSLERVGDSCVGDPLASPFRLCVNR